MDICLERGADLHMAQLMPLPLTVSCFSKIQIGFTFLVPAYPGSPGQRAVKRVCVCVSSMLCLGRVSSVSVTVYDVVELTLDVAFYTGSGVRCRQDVVQRQWNGLSNHLSASSRRRAAR